MRVILHLGIPKTGSSSIQAALEGQRASLAARGVVYPTVFGERGAQYALVLRAVQRMGPGTLEKAFPGRYQGIDPASLEPPDAFETQLAAEIDGADTLVLSCEGIWGAGKRPPVRRALARYLRGLADGGPITLVAYLRRQDLHLVSTWAQLIRGRHAHVGTLDDMMAERFHNTQHAYHDRLEEWREALPEARFVVRPYERGQLEGGDVVRDFAVHAGVPLDPDAPVPHANPSADGVSTGFLRRLNTVLPPDCGEPGRATARHIARRAADAVSAERAAPGSTLPRSPSLAMGRDRALAYLARFAAQNEAVARDYLDRADGVLFRDPVGGPDEPIEDGLAAAADPLDEAMRLAARVVMEAEGTIAWLEWRLAAVERAPGDDA